MKKGVGNNFNNYNKLKKNILSMILILVLIGVVIVALRFYIKEPILAPGVNAYCTGDGLQYAKVGDASCGIYALISGRHKIYPDQYAKPVKIIPYIRGIKQPEQLCSSTSYCYTPENSYVVEVIDSRGDKDCYYRGNLVRGGIWNGASCVKCNDYDKDTFYGESASCSRSFLQSISKFDCNDNNGGINPGQSEVCNRIDDDCDAVVDEGCWELIFENVLGYEYQPVSFIIPNLEFNFQDDSIVASDLIGFPPEEDVYHEIYLENKNNGKIYDSELIIKGVSRRDCYPFNMNIKFDKEDLFYLSTNSLGYKKLRFMPECSRRSKNEKWVHPIEYINYKIFKQFDFKELEVIGFVHLDYENHLGENEDWKNYLLIQRTSENDDEIPFLEQHQLIGRNADGDVYGGKTEGVDFILNYYDWDYYTKLTDLETGEEYFFDEYEMANYYILINFFDNHDTVYNNANFAKEKDSDLFHIIPYDFDDSFSRCENNKLSFENILDSYWVKPGDTDFYITQISLDSKIEFYRQMGLFYTNNENLLNLFQYVDESPFLSNEDKLHLKKILMIRFAQGNLMYGSNEFLLRLFTQEEINHYSIVPFRNVHKDFFQNIVDSVENDNYRYCLDS